jgi:hypothetical protein
MSKKRSMLDAGEENSGKRICDDHQQLLLDGMRCLLLHQMSLDDVDNEMETESQQKSDIADNQIAKDTESGQYSAAFQRKTGLLTLIVDIQHGLLDELLALDVISQQQIDEIQSQRTPSERVAQLLNFVKQMSDEHQEGFLTALRNNQQIHVIEVIRSKGNELSISQELRPFMCCSEWWTLNKNRVKLIELIDLKCGLLDMLFSEGCLSDRQMQTIKAGQTEAHQNTNLLNILGHRSFQDVCKVFDCLVKTTHGCWRY